MQLLNLKWQDADNGGDCVASPCNYFERFRGADIVHMNNWRGLDLKRYDAVIIGSGGLLNEENVPTIQEVIAQAHRVVLWAIGTNSMNAGWTVPDLRAPNVLGWYRHPNGYFGVGPCPSCMLPQLLEQIRPFKSIGFISHKDHLLNPESSNHISNQCSAQQMIRFIQEHWHIKTNSYHAAYFGHLLGRDVEVVDTWSDKLVGCQDGWRQMGDLLRHRQEALSMYGATLDWLAKSSCI